MKKLFVFIIIIFSIFSTFNLTNASSGTLELSLDLKYGPESFDLNNIASFGNYKFRNSDNRATYNFLKSSDYTLRQEFIKKYRKGEYSKSNISGITQTYELFIYHTNRYFYYLSQKDRGINYKNLNIAISRNYKLSRTYYNQLAKMAIK